MADYTRVAAARLVVSATPETSRTRVAGARLVVSAVWPLSAATPAADTSTAVFRGEADISARIWLDPGQDMDPGLDGIDTDLSMAVLEREPEIYDCSRVYNRTRSGLAVSSTDTYDLRGTLLDAYDVGIQFGELRWLAVVNTGTVDLAVSASSSAGITGVWTGTTPKQIVKAGGFFLWSDPSQLDISGGADSIDVANLSGSTTADYEIMIVGRRP